MAGRRASGSLHRIGAAERAGVLSVQPDIAAPLISTGRRGLAAAVVDGGRDHVDDAGLVLADAAPQACRRDVNDSPRAGASPGVDAAQALAADLRPREADAVELRRGAEIL